MADGTPTVERLQAELQELRQIRERYETAQAEVETLRIKLMQRDAELQGSNRQVSEGLEQQTATAEVLRVIATTPTDLTAVLQTIAETAWRLSESSYTGIRLVEGDTYVTVASAGKSPIETDLGRAAAIARARGRRLISERAPGAEAIREGRTVHIMDAQAEEVRARYPDNVIGRQLSTLHVPLLSLSAPIGAITAQRYDEVRPFTDQQIALL